MGGKHFNPLNAELNRIYHLLALLGAHHIFHVSGLRVNAELVCKYSVILVLDRVSDFVNVVQNSTRAMCNTIIGTDTVAAAFLLIVSNWKAGRIKLQSLITYTGVFFKLFNFYPPWLLRSAIK